MTTKRLRALTCALGLFALVGVAQAGAASPTRVLEFTNNYLHYTPIGSNPGSVGSTFVITGRINNAGTAQFGKPSGALIGRILVDCTVLAQNDGICTGIVHLPDGFFTFAGNGPFTTSNLRYYAITGGVGPYANDRGEQDLCRAACDFAR